MCQNVSVITKYHSWGIKQFDNAKLKQYSIQKSIS